MAATRMRSTACQFLHLPLELQLRVLEQLGGPDLCAVEASCRDLRRLVSSNGYLYQHALAEEFGPSIAARASTTDWKALYVQAFVQARLDILEKQRCVYNSLKVRLEELDGLLEQADDVKEHLGAPELLMGDSMVLTIVSSMEQDVLQLRWDASEDLLVAEAKVEQLQSELQDLLSRVPGCWRAASLQVAAACCTIA
ncbi:hypothetical protein Agub_g5370 [Astrephomene gubernaculifera]|uniref:F-box domain-containing protein n=1 Tax=Astrephomene gubernaculifera TaxID=47775 RepID=A0AAD3DLU2_9CHLO|nr:hypothetical protein Agub_g5370 [Astrephomene gubernaculifera]